MQDTAVLGGASPQTPMKIPVRPMTGEDVDAAFQNADDAGDVYNAMEMRCAEFRATEAERGRQARMAGAMTPDTDVMWQGDVGITLMSDAAFNAAKGQLKPITNGGSHVQVAVGTGVGARHTVSSAEVAVFTRAEQSNPLVGPVVVADKGFTLAHPEHQNVEFPPGNYGVCYQRMYADELRRAAD